MSEPKLHHYLPRAYLRAFAGTKDTLILRRRGAKAVLATVGTVAARTHLYSVMLSDGTRDASAEKTLARFDAVGPRALDQLRGMSIPPAGSDERHAVALFMALQMVRTPEHQAQYMFPRLVFDHFGTTDITREQMREYLEQEHLHFSPEEHEVTGAHDVVMAARTRLPSKDDALRSMFDLAIKEMGPRLEAMTWSIEECRKPRFATCDRLPVVWRRPLPSDEYEGVGFVDAEQVWLPLDPSHMLVLRTIGIERVERVEPKRARFVNSHLARHCYSAVFHRHDLPVRNGDLRMAAHGPTTRFSTGPGYQQLPNGAQVPIGDILHLWTPVRDRQG